MEIEFQDEDLKRLLESDEGKSRFPVEVIKMYRKRMQFIRSARDDRDLRAMKSLHFEELKGGRKGQHSIRLNKQYRLVFRIEGKKEERLIVVVSIEDYH